MGLTNTNLRPDWFVDVTAAQQRLAGFTLDGDCATFARGLERFRNELPAPRSYIERRVLHDCVIATLTQAGHLCHRALHQRCPEMSCGGSPLADLTLDWSGTNWDQAIARWSQEYLEAFRDRHIRPAHVRAADYLDRHFRERLRLTELAREVACARTTLTCQFKTAWGMTIGEYQGRLRLRHGIIDLRASDSKVDDVARMLGYRSPKNFYGILKEQTGLTPSEVRGLTESAVQRLFDVSLPMPDTSLWDRTSRERRATSRAASRE